jgi:hypothetical protein
MDEICRVCADGFVGEANADQKHIDHMHKCPIYAANTVRITFPCLYNCGKQFVTEMESMLHLSACFGVVDTTESFSRSTRVLEERTDTHSFATHARDLLENLCSFNRFEDPLYLATLGLHHTTESTRHRSNREIRRTIHVMLRIATGMIVNSSTKLCIVDFVGDITGQTLWDMVTTLLPSIHILPKQYSIYDNIPFAKTFTGVDGQSDQKLVHAVVCLNRYVIAKLTEMGITSRRPGKDFRRCDTCRSMRLLSAMIRSNLGTMRCEECVAVDDNVTFTDRIMILRDGDETFQRSSDDYTRPPKICSICTETRIQFLTCPEDDTHIFCKQCFISQLVSQRGDTVNTDLANTECPSCKAIRPNHDIPSFQRAEVVRLIGPFLTTVHEDLQTYKVFNNVAIKLFLCPHVICRRENDPPYEFDLNKPTMTCPHCKTMFCTQCQMPAHASLTCAFANKDPQRALELLSKRWVETNTRPCPHPTCLAKIEKNGACYHMKCPAPCNTAFCWICGISYCLPGKCDLMGRIAPWSNAAKERFLNNPGAVANWYERYRDKMHNGGKPRRSLNIEMYDPPQHYVRSDYDANMAE